MNSCSKHANRQGVTLLIVVAFIVIAGLALVGVAQQSFRLATDSVNSEAELQQRWGTISLQRTLLRSAPKLFADLDQRSLQSGNSGPFPSTIQTEVLLGGVKFDAMLGDEQAKLNLNSLYHRRGTIAVELAAQKLAGRNRLRTRLAPETKSISNQPSSPRLGSDASNESATDDELEKAASTPPAAFRHWGQIYDLSAPTQAGSTNASSRSKSLHKKWVLPQTTLQLTCWGRGEVNIMRASDDVIAETCRTIVGPGVARKMVQRFRENPVIGIEQVAMQLDVEPQDRVGLRRLLTTQSSTYSLWVASHTLNGPDLSLAVATSVEGSGMRTERFRY